MKKIIAMLLCLVMVFSLCACSAQAISQGGAGFLAMLKQALQNFDFGKIFRMPASGETPAAPGGGTTVPAP